MLIGPLGDVLKDGWQWSFFADLDEQKDVSYSFYNQKAVSIIL